MEYVHLNAIEAHNLTKNYQVYLRPFDRLKEAVLRKPCHDLVEALTDVSFEVPEGGTLGIIGENGAGKSTLLKILAGTALPTSGGTVKRGRLAALLELGSGFHPEFSGRQNIYLNAALLGLKEKEIRDREESIIAFSELENVIDRPVKTYSSGMYVRLAFSVATCVEPDVLIIDEALSVGDFRFQQKCVDWLTKFRDMNKTIIFCSHSMYLINELCSNSIWLDNGRIRGIGKSADVISEYLACMEKKTHPEAPEVKPAPTTGPLPDIMVQDVRILNETGEILQRVRQFQTVVIQIRTRRTGPPIKAHLSLGIGQPNEIPLFVTTTKACGFESFEFEGEQMIEVIVPSLPVARGRYFAHARIGDENALRVIHEMLSSPFAVQTDRPGMGVFWMEHHWQFPPSHSSRTTAKAGA